MHTKVTAITDTPAVVVSANTGAARRIRLKVSAGGPVYFGGSTVTADATPATGGFVWASTDGVLMLDLSGGDSLYAICAAAGTATVRELASN